MKNKKNNVVFKNLKKKKPWLAAILNFLIPGVGYLYNWRRKVFGSLITLMFVLSTIDMIYYNWSPPTTILGIISVLIGLSAFAYDAYYEAMGLTRK